MKVKKTKSHRILKGLLISIASIIILGVLGFVIWQNFFKPAAAPDVVVTQDKEVPKDLPVAITTATASDETLGSGFAITYPKTWTNVHVGAVQPESTASVQTDENTITSPSGNIQVILTVQTNTKVGSNCTSDYIKLKHLEVDTTPNYAEGRFAAYVVYFPGINLYQYHAGLQKNTEAIRGVNLTSNTACNFMFSEFIDRNSSKPNIPLTRTIISIRFVDLYNGENLKSGVDELKVAEKLTGSEYQEAKTIVQSVYIQN